MPAYTQPRLEYFLYAEPWASAKEEGRVHAFIDQAYEAIGLVSEERREAAYHVIVSANAVTRVVLGMN